MLFPAGPRLADNHKNNMNQTAGGNNVKFPKMSIHAPFIYVYSLTNPRQRSRW